MQIINTILPIFVVILTGMLLRQRAFLPQEILGPLNRLVFYLAIPAMVFQKVASASWQEHFQPAVLAGVLLPVGLVFLLVLALARLLRMPAQEKGTFVQCTYHGNLGYIGLAVCFYALGDEGLIQASFLAGFLMLLQNFLSVLVLGLGSTQKQGSKGSGYILSQVLLNPVIISALAGLGFAVAGLGLPVLVDRSLEIISGMALPLALLVIGASLSFGLMREHLFTVLGAGVVKLLLLPALGLLACAVLGLEISEFAPGLLLLAAPPATVTVVMSAQMKGSPNLASAAVALNTLASALGYALWLSLI
ncbi:MAG: AEC family transporter [Desulfohalobiaceae bacterium]